jgi:hypothetical protein
MGQLIGIAFAVLALAVMLFTGLMMLISPKRWFDLPPYLGFHGSMRRSMLSTWGGRFQVRALGGILVSFIVWAVTSTLINPHPNAGKLPRQYNVPGSSLTVSHAFCLLGFLGAIMTGTLILLKPKWYVEKYWRPNLPEGQANVALPLVAIRILGIIPLAAGAYLAWSCLEAIWRR